MIRLSAAFASNAAGWTVAGKRPMDKPGSRMECTPALQARQYAGIFFLLWSAVIRDRKFFPAGRPVTGRTAGLPPSERRARSKTTAWRRGNRGPE